jgi:hypothetical protein
LATLGSSLDPLIDSQGLSKLVALLNHEQFTEAKELKQF